MTKRLLSLVALPVLLFSTGGALAADPVPAAITTAPSEPHTGIGLNLGLGSAVGVAGVTVTGAFGRFARLELGAGAGYSGYQLSVMPKIALGEPHDHFVAGVGVSVAFPDDFRVASGHPIWLNIDALGYEHRFDSGIAVSTTVGASGGLGGGQICSPPPDGCEAQFQHPVTGYWFPQGRASVAYWF